MWYTSMEKKPSVLTSKPLPLITDRTSIEVDQRCGMEYYWYKYAEGGGVVPTTTPDYFEVGGEIHEDMEGLARGLSASEIISNLPTVESCEGDQFKLERLARRIGWLVGFEKTVWAYIKENFTIERIEHELVFERGRLWVQVKPDLLVRSKQSGRLVYIEYKSAASLNNQFVTHWPTAIQLHLGIKAAEEEFGEKVEYGQVIGLAKGRWQYGRLHHPFVYGYYNHLTDAWRPGYIRSDDWNASGSWNYPGGTKAWVGQLGEEEVKAQFVWSEPVFYDDNLIHKMVVSRTFRLEQLEASGGKFLTNPEERARLFEMRTKGCQPSFGDPCPYRTACFNASVGTNPIKSGLYKPRQPHHEMDLIEVE